MQGSSSNSRAEQGLFRKRGAPVLVELMRGASTNLPGGGRVPPPIGSPAAKAASADQGSLFGSGASGAGTPAEAPAAPVPAHVEPKPLHAPAMSGPSSGGASSSAGRSSIPASSRVIDRQRGRVGAGGPDAGAGPGGGPGGGPGSGLSRAAHSAARESLGDRAGAWMRGLSPTGRAVLFALAALVVLVPIIWAVAFNRGQDHAAANLPVEPLPAGAGVPGVAGATGSTIPGGPGGPGGPGPNAGGTGTAATTGTNPPPAPGAGPSTAGARLVEPGPPRKGLNYLVVGTFKRSKDATDTAEYLTAAGLPAMVVAVSEMKPGWKSSDQQVIVLYGFSRETWKESESLRLEVQQTVQRLGAKWKSENRLAPTDLSQSYFDKFGE